MRYLALAIVVAIVGVASADRPAPVRVGTHKVRAIECTVDGPEPGCVLEPDAAWGERVVPKADPRVPTIVLDADAGGAVYASVPGEQAVRVDGDQPRPVCTDDRPLHASPRSKDFGCTAGEDT